MERNGFYPSEPDMTVIIGAGPAGLTAAYELSRNCKPAVVVERDPEYVGGIARTVDYKGFRFDIGGHRFFSKNAEIENLWTEILGPRMIVRDRLSRIYYRGRFFKYPLETFDVLRKLGPIESAACLMSYGAAQCRRKGEIRSFEDWVSDAFGRRLFKMFFESYTEKVWGIPCSQISADWAAQRIKGLSMRELLKRALRVGNGSGGVVKTLIDRFRYPLGGPGEMWQVVTQTLRDRGVAVRLGETVVRLERGHDGITSVITSGTAGTHSWSGRHFISTMPIKELMEAMRPAPPARVLEAARSLKYRDFITVALIIDHPNLFPDQWIYIHEPTVKVGRVQNFKNWSPAMVPDPRFTVLGLEYFCFESDTMWNTPDSELIAMGTRELARLGLVEASRVVDGAVVRQRAAYPVYDDNYSSAVSVVRDFIAHEARNLHLVGRNGMHKYNNQDHAMMTGLMAARNIMGASYDVWRVNSDAEYLEEERENDLGGRLVPHPLAGPSASEIQRTALGHRP